MNRLLKWLESLPGATDPDDLRLDTITEILPILYVLSGIFFFRSLQVRGAELVASIVIGILLVLAGVGARQFRDHNFRIAWSWLVLIILLVVSIESWVFPDSPARFFFGIAVFATSLLTYGSNIIIVSVLSLLAIEFIALYQGFDWLDQEQVLNPGLLIIILGTITFITSRHLHEELQRSRFRGGQIRDMLEQLRQQRVELDRTIKTLELANVRIERMNDELVVARNAAEDADRLKTEFLAHMSHELRTPLNAILNFTAFVADGLMGEVNEEQIDTLQKVMDSGNHLLSLINDILDISKIEAGMMNLFIEEVDIANLLKGTISTSKGLTKNTPVEMIAEIPDDLPTVSGDKRRIRQVFLNLASNAVKFTPEGSVTIGAKYINDEIQVYVKDTGVGIAPDEQDAVFEAFQQAQHDLHYVIGTGLGLPICKHFIEAHGGRIWLESEVGEGSIFFVALPLESKIQEELAAPSDAVPPMSLDVEETTEPEAVVQDAGEPIPEPAVAQVSSEIEEIDVPENIDEEPVIETQEFPVFEQTVEEIADLADKIEAAQPLKLEEEAPDDIPEETIPEIMDDLLQDDEVEKVSPQRTSPGVIDDQRVLDVLQEAKNIIDGIDQVFDAFSPEKFDLQIPELKNEPAPENGNSKSTSQPQIESQKEDVQPAKVEEKREKSSGIVL